MDDETGRELPPRLMPLGMGSRGSAVELWHLPGAYTSATGVARESDWAISPVQANPLGAGGAGRFRMPRQYLPQPLRRRACRESRSAGCLFRAFSRFRRTSRPERLQNCRPPGDRANSALCSRCCGFRTAQRRSAGRHGTAASAENFGALVLPETANSPCSACGAGLLVRISTTLID